MPNDMIPDGRDARPRLTAEQDRMRMQGLRMLARIIVRHHIACQGQVIASDDDCDRDAAGGVGDGSSAAARPSPDSEAA